jgi:hypothetical protein
MRRSLPSSSTPTAVKMHRDPCRRLAAAALLTSGTLAVGLIASSPASAKPQRERPVRSRPTPTQQREPAAISEPAGGSGSSTTPASEPSGPAAPAEASTRGVEAHPQRIGGCRLSVEATSPRISSGETVTVFGALRCPGGAAAADRAVTVYQRAGGETGSTEAGTTTTEADGSYKLTPAAFDSNTIFYVRSPGAHSARTVVKVAPKVTFEGPVAGTQLLTRGDHLPARAHNRMTFTGTVSPADPGALIALQREYAASGEQWRPIAFGRVGLDGRYSITHGFTSPGMASFRVVVHPTGPNLAAASQPLSYEIAQAQNPKLTIQATADPISYGQAVKITGVAAGGEQQVTLLARAAGGTFVALAKQITGTGGTYDFEQSPLQSISYRVSDASTTSTQLFEGVKYALVTAPGPETAQLGQQLTFSGTLAPAHSGQAVLLERESPSGINFNIIEAATVGAGSSYSIAYTFYHACNCVMRIRVPASGENQASTSEQFSIQVLPALAGGLSP